jgi:glycerol-3-phosphate dehydrogenase
LVRTDPSLGDRLDPALPTIGAEVVWSARHEMARTVEDALARRSRALFLDARAAIRMAPRVADLMAKELGRDDAWRSAQVEAFTGLASGYLPG